MGIAAGLAGAASAASLASSASNLLGSGGGSAPAYGTYGGNPATYIPTAQPSADAAYQGIFNQMQPYTQALPGQVIPGLQTYVANIQANPYAPQALTGAQQVATAGQGVGTADIAAGQALTGAGNQILTTAFDPQTALYNQLQNQTTQQAAAANAMAGVAGPYAAGTTDQALQNFNIAWQNQQLARQAQGEQIAGQAFSGAAGLGGTGLGALQSTSALPYQTYLGQQQADIGGLSALTSGTSAAFGPSENLANLLQSYLGLGQSATGLAQAGQAQGFSQQQQLGQQFGQSLQGLGQSLGTLFSSPTPTSSPYGTFQGTVGGYSPVFSYGSSAPSFDPNALAGAF